VGGQADAADECEIAAAGGLTWRRGNRTPLALSTATRAGSPVTRAALPQALAAALMLAPPAAQPASH